MAKKQNAIYEPGELDRVRGKLGDIDVYEAKRMAQILGGEVGTEKSADTQQARSSGARRGEPVELAAPGQKRRSVRHVDLAGMDEEEDGLGGKSGLGKMDGSDPDDDPDIQLKTSYHERVKMDRYAAQFDYEIKSAWQVFVSAVSLFAEPIDYLNPRFVNRRMSESYTKIEHLVTATRGLFPRNNARRSERLKKASPFVYSILDTIRDWNIERIGEDLAQIQAHPRSVKVADFADILRAIYKPLFSLEKLDMDIHIKGTYKLLYKLLHIETPTEPREKNQELIRIALASYTDIRREVHYGLYPLLMKIISDRWFPYGRLFSSRHNRYMAFLNVTEEDQIKMIDFSPEHVDTESLEEENKTDESGAAGQDAEGGEDLNDPEVIARKAREQAIEAERKVLEHSLNVMESLFPKAGWDKLPDYPDLYPYFAGLYELRRGFDLIAPTDPLLQIAVLMYILEDLCAALHYISFGLVIGPEGNHVHVNEAIGGIITNWQQYIDESIVKEYLPRLSEYCHMLEHSTDSRSSVYAKRTMNELRWTKRLYFMPYYKFDSLGPPPFQNNDRLVIYTQVRTLRKYLTLVAAGIKQGSNRGGAEAKAPCNGIDNPWAQYNFEIPNPVSKRMNALLSPPKRNNAAVIFFALSVATILDYLINNESSWAYNDSSASLFRSLNGDGVTPMFGVTEKVDADKIFRESLKRKEVRK
jgi:hypothetical protein